MITTSLGFVSAAQRRKQMGQKNDDVFLSYISRISGVDTQAIINGKEPDQGLMNVLQGMAVNLNTDASKPHGSQLTDIRGHPKAIGRPEKSIRPPPTPSADPPRVQSYEDNIPRPPASRSFLRYLSWEPDRQHVIRAFYDAPAKYSFDSVVAHLSRIADPSHVKWHYPQAGPDKENRCPDCEKPVLYVALSFKHAITTLILARPDPFNANLHLLNCFLDKLQRQMQRAVSSKIGERVSRCQWGRCLQGFHDAKSIKGHIGRHVKQATRICLWSDCRQQADSGSDLRRHVFEAHIPLPGSVDTEQATPAYCYECREYFIDASTWSAHCIEHLSNLDMFCGQIVHRGVVITAFRCMFCLGDTSLEASTRYKQRPRSYHFRAHVRRHLETYHEHSSSGESQRLLCPHPLCLSTTYTWDDFQKHCSEEHGFLLP
jgi:hypothetical protein